MIQLTLRKTIAALLFLFLTVAVAEHAASSDPVVIPCDPNDPNCGAAPPKSGCDQKCRMRKQFQSVTKLNGQNGIFNYDVYDYIFEFHTCDQCKNSPTGYCHFNENTNDMNTDGTCGQTSVKNRSQPLMSTPLCDVTNWKTKANTGDWIVVEAMEMMPKMENFNDDVKIFECKAKQ